MTRVNKATTSHQILFRDKDHGFFCVTRFSLSRTNKQIKKQLKVAARAGVELVCLND